MLSYIPQAPLRLQEKTSPRLTRKEIRGATSTFTSLEQATTTFRALSTTRFERLLCPQFWELVCPRFWQACPPSLEKQHHHWQKVKIYIHRAATSTPRLSHMELWSANKCLVASCILQQNSIDKLIEEANRKEAFLAPSCHPGSWLFVFHSQSGPVLTTLVNQAHCSRTTPEGFAGRDPRSDPPFIGLRTSTPFRETTRIVIARAQYQTCTEIWTAELFLIPQPSERALKQHLRLHNYKAVLWGWMGGQ